MSGTVVQGSAPTTSFLLPNHGSSAVKHSNHFPQMEFKFYHDDELPNKREATADATPAADTKPTVEGMPTATAAANLTADAKPTAAAKPSDDAAPTRDAARTAQPPNGYASEVAWHAQQVCDIQAVPVQSENVGALIQELLGAQEAIRFELNQLKMQVDAQSTEIEALRRDQYTRRSSVPASNFKQTVKGPTMHMACGHSVADYMSTWQSSHRTSAYMASGHPIAGPMASGHSIAASQPMSRQVSAGPVIPAHLSSMASTVPNTAVPSGQTGPSKADQLASQASAVETMLTPHTRLSMAEANLGIGQTQELLKMWQNHVGSVLTGTSTASSSQAVH